MKRKRAKASGRHRGSPSTIERPGFLGKSREVVKMRSLGRRLAAMMLSLKKSTARFVDDSQRSIRFPGLLSDAPREFGDLV